MSEPEAERDGSAGADKRRERRPIAMRGFVTLAGGITHPIELVDLNYGGCGIATPVELTPGDAIKLSVLGRGSMPAVVRWCRDGKAGLDFEAAFEQPKQMVERGADRIDVPGEISLRAAGKNPYRVRVLDLSTDGCKVELVERPRVGDQMRVKFEGLEVLDAEVCWVEDFVAGLRFDRHLHPAVRDLLIGRLNGW
jgi:hypothetical protein